MDLKTQYLGMALAHPILASASPLSRTPEGVCRLARAGASAVVLPSLFAEQISVENDARLGPRTEMLFPGWSRDPLGAQEYLDLIALSRRMCNVPVIASLNADGPGKWTAFAKTLENAGANALELNLYYVAADPDVTPDAVEQRYVDAVAEVRAACGLPLAVKIGPFFTALPHFARRLATAGANGLVLFNRFYEPDFDPETRDVAKRDVVMSQSRHDLRLPLRWTAVLSRELGDDIQIAITGGVHSGLDAVKAIMAGATVVEVASELLTNGEHRLTGIRDELAAWMQAHDHDSLEAILGVLRANYQPLMPSAVERAGYIGTIRSQE